MADSVALEIQKAVETRLNLASVKIDGVTYTPPASLTIERERVTPIQPKHVMDGPIINIDMAGQKPTVRKHYKDKLLVRTLELTMTIAANATEVANPDALDPATNWMIQALQSEPTLGGIAHWISEEGQEDFKSYFDESAEIVAIREMKIEIEFHTRTENPEVRS